MYETNMITVLLALISCGAQKNTAKLNANNVLEYRLYVLVFGATLRSVLNNKIWAFINIQEVLKNKWRVGRLIISPSECIIHEIVCHCLWERMSHWVQSSLWMQIVSATGTIESFIVLEQSRKDGVVKQ